MPLSNTYFFVKIESEIAKPVRFRAGFVIMYDGDSMRLDKFYKSKKWKHKREIILRRDCYQCQDCKRYGRKRQAITVHHIKHLDEFPELALNNNNLISLCADCHNKRHPEKGGGRY